MPLAKNYNPEFVTKGKWKEGFIDVAHDELCSVEGHKLEVLHHTNDPEDLGRHWCPTMFLMCAACGGLADEPAPYSCTFWDEAPNRL